MIADLLDRLLDRVIDLTRERGKLLRAGFAETVVPIYQELVHLHEEYMEMFRRYRDILTNSDKPVASVLETIATDRMFNHTNRSMVFHAALAAREVIDDVGFRDFADRILHYVSQASAVDEHGFSREASTQRWAVCYVRLVHLSTFEFKANEQFIRRASPLGMIRLMGDPEHGFHRMPYDRKEAVKLLDLVVWIMQREFDEIAVAYEELRTAWVRRAPLS